MNADYSGGSASSAPHESLFVGQTSAVQLDKLTHCDQIFQEKRSGAFGKWPRLEAYLKSVREENMLGVTRLVKLAGSTLHMRQIAAELECKQVHLQLFDQKAM